MKLNASVSAPPCTASAGDVVSVFTANPPTITITPVDMTVCMDAAWKVFSFNVQALNGVSVLPATVLGVSPSEHCVLGGTSGEYRCARSCVGGWQGSFTQAGRPALPHPLPLHS